MEKVPMGNSLSLAFIDNDRFFIEGLQRVLLSYFARRAIPVRLLDPAAAAQADMVFQSVEGIGRRDSACVPRRAVNRLIFLCVRRMTPVGATSRAASANRV